jgi:hypothetical protein
MCGIFGISLFNENSNAFKSGKFFKNLADITKQDKEKKDLKRSSK